MGIQVVQPPYLEPVTLAEAKVQCRIDPFVTAEDDLISTLIPAAREWAEAYMRRTLVTTRYRLTMDRFPFSSTMDPMNQQNPRYDNANYYYGSPDRFAIWVPRCPLVSVQSISYTDQNNSTNTLSTSSYTVDGQYEPGRITPAYGTFWPGTLIRAAAVTVLYTAGMSTPVTVSSSTFTSYGRTFSNDDTLYVWSAGGLIPSGLNAGAMYYVVNASGSTFQLSTTSSGSAVSLSSAGSGNLFAGTTGTIPRSIIAAIKLLVSHLWQNRELNTNDVDAIPRGVQHLLYPHRIMDERVLEYA